MELPEVISGIAEVRAALKVGEKAEISLRRSMLNQPFDVALPALLLEEYSSSVEEGRRVEVVRPQNAIARARWDELDSEGEVCGIPVETPASLPSVKEFDLHDGKISRYLLDRVSERIELYPDVRSLVYACLKELTDNAKVHALPDAKAVAAIQVLPETESRWDGISLCVLDSGTGIPATLRRHKRYHGEKDDRNLIELAVQRGVTGTRDNRGFGLWIIRKLLEENQGQLWILSGSAMMRYNMSNFNVYRRFTKSAFQGTAVQIEISNSPDYRFHFEDYMSDIEVDTLW